MFTEVLKSKHELVRCIKIYHCRIYFDCLHTVDVCNLLSFW